MPRNLHFVQGLLADVDNTVRQPPLRMPCAKQESSRRLLGVGQQHESMNFHFNKMLENSLLEERLGQRGGEDAGNAVIGNLFLV